MSTWIRAFGVSLNPTTFAEIEADPSLMHAVADGVAHNFDGTVPPFPERAQWFLVHERGEVVGCASVQREHPRPGEATLLTVAIAPERRGRAAGTKALLAAERKLLRDGASRMLTRVSRTNGHGLYFMLRCGYVPVPVEERPGDEPGWEDTTWFARVPPAVLR